MTKLYTPKKKNWKKRCKILTIDKTSRVVFRSITDKKYYTVGYQYSRVKISKCQLILHFSNELLLSEKNNWISLMIWKFFDIISLLQSRELLHKQLKASADHTINNSPTAWKEVFRRPCFNYFWLQCEFLSCERHGVGEGISKDVKSHLFEAITTWEIIKMLMSEEEKTKSRCH